ncbi:MAG: hypothetical protein ACTSRK_10300 [Promethearchaeota archaeon]
MTKSDYDKLLENPNSLYLLYQLFVNYSDNLPGFIDRGVEAYLLTSLGLTAQRGIAKKKHIHKQPLVLSTAGTIFCEDYCTEIFESIKSLTQLDRDSLINICNEYKNLEYKWQEKEYFHEELSFFPKIGESRRQKNVEMQICKYRRLDESGLVFEFEIQFTCRRCKEITMFTQKIKISEDQYDPIHFLFPCEQCHLIFYCDSYFQVFYMDD